MQTSVEIPAPTDEDKPFPIGDELTVYEAAMVYAGRHPYPKMFGPYDDESSRRERCLTLLKLGLKEASRRKPVGHRSRNRRGRPRARRSLDIHCEIMERIKRGLIQPVKTAYDLDGEIDPTWTVIKTTELIKLANERGEQPRYLGHLPKQAAATTPQSEHERDVIAYATEFLEKSPNATFNRVLSHCRDRFPGLSKNAFRERFWSPSRLKAGLPAQATPGPKPKAGEVPILDDREKHIVSNRQRRDGSQGPRPITLPKVNLPD